MALAIPAFFLLYTCTGGICVRAPKISKVYYSLTHWQDFRLKLFGEGILIGMFVGIIVVAFRYLL